MLGHTEPKRDIKFLLFLGFYLHDKTKNDSMISSGDIAENKILHFTCPTSINLLKKNHGNCRKICKICSKLTIKIPELRNSRPSGIFILNFELVNVEQVY